MKIHDTLLKFSHFIRFGIVGEIYIILITAQSPPSHFLFVKRKH